MRISFGNKRADAPDRTVFLLGSVETELSHLKPYLEIMRRQIAGAMEVTDSGAGDTVLRMIAAELEKSVRSYDLVFRYGGEEFVMLMPGATAEDALLRAEQCRDSVRKLGMRHHGREIGPITLSMGVAAYPEQGEDDLLSAADQALYEAKHNGRDRCCVAPRKGE